MRSLPSAFGVVPARAGSKGLPRKNLLPVAGEPLVARAVRIATEATTLSAVICSTDSTEIAEAATHAGAEIVMRPAELADDDSPTEDALLHVLDMLEAMGRTLPEYIVTLEPTSPLRTAGLIDRCVERAAEMDADAVITVAASTDSWGTLEDGVFHRLDPQQARRRQLRPPLYRESSTVYVTRTTHLRSARSVIADPLYAVIVESTEAVDINTLADLAIAEALLQAT